MKKIVVRMRGGLGNQLFIISFAYYVVKKLGLSDYEIVLDNREYENYKIRKFDILDLLDDSNIRLYDKDKDKSLKYEITRKFYHTLQKVLPRKVPILKIFSSFGLLYTRSNSKLKDISSKFDTYYIYGYFQDERIFNQVKRDLMEKIDFSFEDEYLDKKVKNIAISIRWGEDYIEQGWPICNKEYYKKALTAIIHEKYNNEKYNILVFSDEIEKVREAQIFENVIYIENRNPIEQLKLIMCCNDFILSNSSFSWCGAYLGMTTDSMVIAPKYWYPSKKKTKNTLLNFNELIIM